MFLSLCQIDQVLVKLNLSYVIDLLLPSQQYYLFKKIRPFMLEVG
jgi:hypothetical protein